MLSDPQIMVFSKRQMFELLSVSPVWNYGRELQCVVPNYCKAYSQKKGLVFTKLHDRASRQLDQKSFNALKKKVNRFEENFNQFFERLYYDTKNTTFYFAHAHCCSSKFIKQLG
jgi:hypothetical protein